MSNSKRVVIVGAGGFGRGLYSWLKSSPRHLEAKAVAEVVFIDDSTPQVKLDAPCIGSISEFKPEASDEVICALGQPALRKAVVERLQRVGAKFHTFVDDRATLGMGVALGDGAVVCPGTVISANATIGNHVHVNFNCSVGHDTVLKDYVTLSPSANVMGQVTVGQATFLGGSAVVLPRISIGERVVIGAGAVCVNPVNPDLTVVGNPAHVIVKKAGQK